MKGVALHLGVVAIEKGAFRSTSTAVAKFFIYYLFGEKFIQICLKIDLFEKQEPQKISHVLEAELIAT